MDNITGATHDLLTPPLLDKLADVERRLGRCVVFYRDPTLAGVASGRARPDGHVFLAPASTTSLAVVGEEIMHLHRWAQGYPAIRPTDLAQRFGYYRALQALGGHFDHHAFFPFLEGTGLDPRAEICRQLASTGDLLERRRDEIACTARMPKWGVTVPVVYVESALLAPASVDRDRVLRLFDDVRLHADAAIGELLVAEVAGAQHEGPDQVDQRMRRCLYEHLRLSQREATVGPS